MRFTREATDAVIAVFLILICFIPLLLVLSVIMGVYDTSVTGAIMLCANRFCNVPFHSTIGIILVSIVVVLGIVFFLITTKINAKRKKEIERLNNYDGLTDALSKNGFYKYAAALLAIEKDTRYCIAAIDIFRFKIINEVYGRGYGDNILKGLIDCLKKEFRDRCIYCRFSGDVFMVCMPFEFTYIERIRSINAKLDERFTEVGGIVLSIGVYVTEDLTMPIATMCDRAYMASKSIKGSYTNRFAMYDDNLRESLLEERELTSHIKEGLEKGEFKIYLQPKYSLDTELITGAEALIRWFHPNKGLISPSKFIPIFERNGLIFDLDMFVLETVCKLIKSWKEQGKKVFPISINISRRNILQNHIAETIKEVLDTYDIEPQLVHLEVTETAYIDNPEMLNKVIAKLRSYGFIISIDDFGSGYSSLNTLKDVPVDILKVDLKFLLNFEKDGKGASILSAVVRMAKSLDMQVIAEGVETKEQASFLRSLGCGYAQGYYYSKPIAVADFESLSAAQEQAIHCEHQIDFLSELDIENYWENGTETGAFLRNLAGGFGLYEIKDGVIMASRVNDAYFKLLNCPRDLYYQQEKNAIDWVHPLDRSRVAATFIKTLETHLPEDVIYRRQSATGELLWIRGKLCYLAGNKAHSLYYVYLTDITNIVKTEANLRINEKKYQTIMSNMQDIVFEWHKKTDKITVCTKFQDIFGYKENYFERFSENFFKARFINEEDKELVHNAFFSVFYGEQRVELNCRVRHSKTEQYTKCNLVMARVDNDAIDDFIVIGIVSII